MSIPQITPPRVSEVLPQVQTKLNVSSITTDLGGSYIYVAEGDSLNIEWPSLTDGRVGRIVLMEQKPQPKFEYLDKSFAYRFKVRADFKPAEGDSPNEFLENIQQLVFAALQWQLLTLSLAKQIYPVVRMERQLTPLFEKSENFYYLTSTWSINLTSTDN